MHTLVAHENRNAQIINNELKAMDEERSFIVFTEGKEQLELMRDRLKGIVWYVVILQGGRSMDDGGKSKHNSPSFQ